MVPQLSKFDGQESGIKRVVENYIEYGMPEGIEIVDCDIEDERAYDIFAVHAGSTSRYPVNKPICAHLHGLYWSADYKSQRWELAANANVVEAARRATVITVPSGWVAKTIRRDMRIDPVIVPHGIRMSDWENTKSNDGYVLWNKNRNADVCNPFFVGVLAERFPETHFITTFAPHGVELDNILTIGVQRHDIMKDYIQHASVYLSTTKETFGIGILEALASGIPVLGFDNGGNRILVKHGVNGYLASPNDYDDLARGLEYVVKFRNILSANAVIAAREWTWENAVKSLKYSYDLTLELWEYGKRQKYLT